MSTPPDPRDVSALERFLVRVQPYIRDRTVRAVVLERLLVLHEATPALRAAVEEALKWASVEVLQDLPAAPAPPPTPENPVEPAAPTVPDPNPEVWRPTPEDEAERALPELDVAVATARRLLAERRAGANRHRVLNAQLEVGLSVLVRDGRLDLDQELPAGWRRHLPSNSEAAAAFDALAEHNMRLVWKIARGYVNQGLDYDDLAAHGMFGLMRAIEKYDATQGYKFSTYATWWIRQRITRALADEAAMIRLPVHIVEKINKIRRAYSELSLTQTEVSVHDVALMAGFEVAEVIRLLRLQSGILSLDASMSDDDADLTLGALVKGSENVEDVVEYNLTRETLDRVLQTLPERDAAVLALRFGLIDGDEKTLEEIGQEFGLTRERIRQIEAKALQKMRHPSRATKLRGLY